MAPLLLQVFDHRQPLPAQGPTMTSPPCSGFARRLKHSIAADDERSRLAASEVLQRPLAPGFGSHPSHPVVSPECSSLPPICTMADTMLVYVIGVPTTPFLRSPVANISFPLYHHHP